MTNQVSDKVTVGIPADVDLARAEVRAAGKAAEAAAGQAERWASRSADSAEEAAQAAARAGLYADQVAGLVAVGPDEPADRWDGRLWVQTSGERAVSLNIWDSTDVSGALVPAPDLLPAPDLPPAGPGSWTRCKLTD